MSDYYIANHDNTNKVYFNIDPREKTWIEYNPIISQVQPIPKYYGGSIIPADTVYFLGGAESKEISVKAQYIDESNYELIMTKFKETESAVFSPDGGVHKYYVVLADKPTIEDINGTAYKGVSFRFYNLGAVS